MNVSRLFALLTLVFLFVPQLANADVSIFSEDFSGYNAGDSVDGATTANGTGVFDTNGNVAVNASGQLILTADGGRDGIQISSSGAECGNYCFDMVFLGDSDTAAANTDIIFLQMGQGGRSTNNNPLPNFSDTVDASTHGISTDIAAPSRVNYFFNTTANPMLYTAPDGSTRTLNTGSYDYWVDTTLTDGNQTGSNNGGGFPTAVDTLNLQTFNGQLGESWAFDNFELISITHVPEPSSLLVLGMLVCGFSMRRSRG